MTVGRLGGQVVIQAARSPLQAANAGAGAYTYAWPDNHNCTFPLGNNAFCLLPDTAPRDISFAVEEWDFPTIEVGSNTVVTGSVTTASTRRISPLQPTSVTPTAACSWNVVLEP